MNCDLNNVCGGVLPPISGEVEVTLPAKDTKGPRAPSLGEEFQLLNDRSTESGPEGSCL